MFGNYGDQGTITLQVVIWNVNIEWKHGDRGGYFQAGLFGLNQMVETMVLDAKNDGFIRLFAYSYFSIYLSSFLVFLSSDQMNSSFSAMITLSNFNILRNRHFTIFDLDTKYYLVK